MSMLLVVWSADSPLLGMAQPNALFLPASVPAALAMQDRGIRALRTSDFVESRDFHEIWEQVISTVWRSIEASVSAAKGEEPRLLPIFGYSIALAVAQLLVLGRLLDRIHARHCLAEVRLERGHGTAEHAFGSGLDDMFYCDIAAEWAAARGIACQVEEVEARSAAVAPSAPAVSPQPQQSSWLDPLRRLKRMLVRRAAEVREGPVGQLLAVARAVVRRNRIVLLTNGAHRLPGVPARLAGDIAIVPIAGHLPAPGPRSAAKDAVGTLLGSAAWKPVCELARPFDGYLARRLAARVASLWRGGTGMYRYASWLARAVRAGGATPVILADSVGCDFIPAFAGFAAEAFRRHGGLIAEFQHGGNYTCVARGFVPTILTTGLGHLFLEWNDLGCREHQTYGLEPPHLTFVDVGCSSTAASAAPSRAAGPISGDRPLRALYAPTLLSTTTICGFNVLWDDYVGWLDRVLRLLDRSPMKVDVSYVPNDEVQAFLSRRQYPNLRFHPMAFRRLAGSADILIAEMLAGSPAYEATMTDRPAIVLTGCKYIEADPRFLADLRRRCIAYDDFDSYLAGVEELVADPRGYLDRNPRIADPQVMARYFRPLDADRFWNAVSALGGGRAREAVVH
jgi:hypothetical protein